MTAALDRAVANAMGLKSVHNCEKWAGLTDEEIYEADPLPHLMFDQQRIDFARAIEAKLKEKNNERQ